jgi:biopolymer transport protein ExbD
MRRRTSRGFRDAEELDLTAMINMMVILVCFLLISAVFSRVTVLELKMPPAAPASPSNTKPPQQEELALEVIVRKNSIEIADRNGHFYKKLDNLKGAYDVRMLAQELRALKGKFPKKRDASVLLEDDVAYEVLVQVMDALRENTAERDNNGNSTELFPDISIGDAPPDEPKK